MYFQVDIRNPVLTISENLQLHKMLNNLGDWGGRRASSTDASGLDGDTLNEESQLSRRGRLRGFMLRLPRKVNFSMNSLSFQVMKDNWVPGLSFELVHFTGSLCNDSGAVGKACLLSFICLNLEIRICLSHIEKFGDGRSLPTYIYPSYECRNYKVMMIEQKYRYLVILGFFNFFVLLRTGL